MPGPKKTVLVIDDSSTLRKILRRFLEPEGFSVQEAVNGAGALLLVPTLRPDLILVDYQMERMDGMEFLRSLRKMDPPVRDTPVIGMSSVEEGRILGDLASAFLKKPFQKEQLIEAIRKLGV